MSYTFFKRSYIQGQGGTNQSNCDQFWFDLKTVLKSNGWSCVRSSDGTTVSSVGSDNITLAGSGAGGMNNSNSWFIMQAPVYGGKTRQMMFYKVAPNNNTQNQYRNIGYSMQGYSTTVAMGGGSISVTAPPIAYDGIVMVGPYSNGVNSNLPSYCQTSASTIGADPTNNFFSFPTPLSTSVNLTIFHYIIGVDSGTGAWFAYIYDNMMRPVSICGYDPLTETDSAVVDNVAIVSCCNLNQGLLSTNNYNGNYNFGKVWGMRPGSNFTSLSDTASQNYYRAEWAKPITLMTSGESVFSSGSNIYSPPNSNGAVLGFPDTNSKQAQLLPAYYVYTNAWNEFSMIRGRSTLFYIPMDGRYYNMTLSTSGNTRDLLCIGDSLVSAAQLVIPWDNSVPLN